MNVHSVHRERHSDAVVVNNNAKKPDPQETKYWEGKQGKKILKKRKRGKQKPLLGFLNAH